MLEQQEIEVSEYEGYVIKVILTPQKSEEWIAGVEVSGRRAATTVHPFKDKSEARNYALAIAKCEIARLT
jgi:hypothetical protein